MLSCWLLLRECTSKFTCPVWQPKSGSCPERLSIPETGPIFKDGQSPVAVFTCSFAAANEGLVADAVPEVSYVYMSTSYLDDLAYAAAWLNVATGESSLIPDCDV